MPHEILHILGTAEPEGSSMVRIVSALAVGLDPAHYRLHALFLQGSGPLVKTLNDSGVPASAIDWWRGMRDPLGAVKFWTRLRGRQYSIIQMHFGGRSVSSLVRSATGAKIVRHLHGRILEPKGLAPVNFSARGVDRVVAVSQAVADRVVDGPARVIYAGLPFRTSEPPAARPPDSELVIGTAGRLVELKGIEYLIRAAAVLQGEFPNLRVEIAGAGPWRSRLENEVARAGMVEKVRFLGWVEDLAPLLKSWDIFALPSLEEGFPIAALDAMAAGLPTVASLVGGVPELIEDGASGFLVPPRDVEALASRLRILLNQRELRISVGARGFKRALNHFDSGRMAENFTKFYDEILN